LQLPMSAPTPSSKKSAAKPSAPKARGQLPKAAGSKRVYCYGPAGTEGDAGMQDLLGGKGANLAEMCRLGLPVPPGFTITTDVSIEFLRVGGAFPAGLNEEVATALSGLEKALGKRFGDPHDPLLVSVRSGARVSMPGMMDTVLNLGLNDTTVEGLARKSGNRRFAFDAYRRFVQMYGDVVLGVRGADGEDECPFHAALDAKKRAVGARADTDLSAADLEELVGVFKGLVRAHTGREFPQDPTEQLWGAIAAVFRSWNNDRAVAYRQMNRIPTSWGTAVSVVAMVYGNLGEDSGTGVAFTRNPSTGEKRFYGEYLPNAQGEDVVAGVRTPLPIEHLEETQPRAWRDLQRIQKLLERHWRDMQDLEFTIQEGQLFMLQCRAGKRTGFAAVRIAVDLVKERRISPKEALLRVDPEALEQLLRPVFDPAQLEAARRSGRRLTRGLNAGPGAATGRIAFTPTEAVRRKSAGEAVVLVRIETSPEDIKGMQAAVGILTARGGMTSHAALVARQMGRVCVAGAGQLEIDTAAKRMTVGGQTLAEGDWISIDGNSGEVYAGQISTRPSEVLESLLGDHPPAERTPIVAAYHQLLGWADRERRMDVRTNADQGDQAATAIALGAEGIGLCRTEHMFFGERKIDAVREMILAEDPEQRAAALAKLLPLQRADFAAIFKAMAGFPVTVRSLDPPLHEFLPHEPEQMAELAINLGVDLERLSAKIHSLYESNPMLGHRGCRLGISYPEITRTQARALFEAAVDVFVSTGRAPLPEVMIPLVSTARELELQAGLVRAEAEAVFAERGVRFPYLVGTMIELPRAALTADLIAEHADFFSFGTNDLTQTTFGISRDDAGKFIPLYIEQEIFPADPFANLDEAGVGKLLEIACEGGRRTRPGIKLGICGEHGGDPRSIDFCERLDLDYISCSPYRVPIARLAAAQAALRRNPG